LHTTFRGCHNNHNTANAGATSTTATAATTAAATTTTTKNQDNDNQPFERLPAGQDQLLCAVQPLSIDSSLAGICLLFNWIIMVSNAELRMAWAWACCEAKVEPLDGDGDGLFLP